MPSYPDQEFRSWKLVLTMPHCWCDSRRSSTSSTTRARRASCGRSLGRGPVIAAPSPMREIVGVFWFDLPALTAGATPAGVAPIRMTPDTAEALFGAQERSRHAALDHLSISIPDAKSGYRYPTTDTAGDSALPCRAWCLRWTAARHPTAHRTGTRSAYKRSRSISRTKICVSAK